MLTNLHLYNFRAFDSHEIPFRPVTVIVGRNNAGKSTIVEALRLLSIITERYRNLNYHHHPEWLDVPLINIGVSPSLKNLEINFQSIFNRYRDPPATITASFQDNSTITIYVGGEDRIHAVIKDYNGRVIRSKSEAKSLTLPIISTSPQVAPLQRNEVVLTSDYVRSSVASQLTHLHFRNQLNAYYSLFRKFQGLVETTWPSVKILELIGHGGLPRESLFLQVRNEDFVAEVSSMGHGLQMWLQTMWFLTRQMGATTIVLDEPDVYMHPDLQRRILRFLRKCCSQLIVTTHSVEIMAEAQPDEILIVSKRRAKSNFASSLPAVQTIIKNLGSTHNIHLARLWDANRFIMVEGKDIRILKQIQNVLFPETNETFDMIPNMPIGGWGAWKLAIGSSMALKNAVGEGIIIYCLFDSDYFAEEEIRERLDEARRRGVCLHVWSRKEIENYLIIPRAIHRAICSSDRQDEVNLSVENVEKQIVRISQGLEEVAFDAISEELQKRTSNLRQGGANKRAREIVNAKKNEKNGLLDIVSGKAVISQISKWSQEEFGISVTVQRYCERVEGG